jgi:hypothetical protein
MKASQDPRTWILDRQPGMIVKPNRYWLNEIDPHPGGLSRSGTGTPSRLGITHNKSLIRNDYSAGSSILAVWQSDL